MIAASFMLPFFLHILCGLLPAQGSATTYHLVAKMGLRCVFRSFDVAYQDTQPAWRDVRFAREEPQVGSDDAHFGCDDDEIG